MSDIFISYARSTEAEARRIVEALRGLGYGVWRDDEIPAHRTYAEVIEERLRTARAVVVVWSAEAATSQWVRSETDRARIEGKLVQVAIDGAVLPMPFDQIQFADLRGWEGEAEHPGWRKVVGSVAELVGGAKAAPAPAAAGPAPASPGPLTFVMADIEGASLLWLNHRAVMQDASAATGALLSEAARRHGCEVFQSAGEIGSAAFQSPAEAILAASEAQVALAARTFPGIGALKARMAIHCGAAERRGGEWIGPALNRCAKLLALGHGGQILITSAVAERLAGSAAASLRSLGSHPLEDPLASVGIHQVIVEGLPQEFPPLRLPEAHPNNMPKRHGALIGREAEMAQLAALLEKSDLVTITGTGGVGKTRIAIEVGLSQLGDHEDGVWLVELAPLSDPEQVPGAIARAMGIQLPAGQDVMSALVDRLQPRKCLIVLDNCEHVIDAVAGFVEAVLEGSRGVKLLASSQELLGVEGERVFRLRSLGEPDAAALFAERARAVDEDFNLGGRKNATAIAAICRRLDGIPLAIEMAAARAPSLGCEGVLQRLDDRFRVLTGGRRTALPRQRTLQATLDWSHGLLNERDAAVFRRLGVFTGGCSLEAASEVAADDRLDSFEVIDALSSLVAKSLIAADTEDNRTRYRLLETTRAYALEKLALAQETNAIQRKHAEYFLKFASPAKDDYYGITDDAFYSRYVPDLDNIERAIDWAFGPGGDAELGIALTAVSYTVWLFPSLGVEYRQWLDTAAAAMTEATPALMRVRIRRTQASSYLGVSQDRSIEFADEAIEALRGGDDLYSLVDAVGTKLNALMLAGRAAEARPVAAELGALIAGLPPSRLTVTANWRIGALVWTEDGADAARPLFDAGVGTAQAIGADGWANNFLVNGTTSLIPADDPDLAIDGLRGVLARIRPRHMFSIANTAGAASQLMGLLATRGGPGDLDEALSLARTFEKTVGRSGLVWMNLLNLAVVAVKSGRPQDAARLAGYADAERAAQGAENVIFRELSEQTWALISAELPETELASLRAEGAKMSRDEALRLALAET